jgi:anthranilate phosphoribosyltransferase
MHRELALRDGVPGEHRLPARGTAVANLAATDIGGGEPCVSYGAHLKQIARPDGDGRGLAPEDAAQLFGAMLDGGVPELELGALLVALRLRGETLSELLGAYLALCERVHRLEPPAGDVRTIVIGTYAGARNHPNLTPLVALLLRRMGVPVLLHGTLEGLGRVASAYILRELGVLPCGTLAQAQGALDADRIAFVPTAVVAPGLANLLALRSRLGIANTAHRLAPFIDPLPGASVRLVGATGPDELELARELLLATGEAAIVLLGTDGEPFADPRRRPRIERIEDGVAQPLFDEEHAPLDATPPTPESLEAKATAAYIRRVLEGGAPLPQPIANELACCLLAAGLAADLNEAKALAALHLHSLAAA